MTALTTHPTAAVLAVVLVAVLCTAAVAGLLPAAMVAGVPLVGWLSLATATGAGL